MSAHVVCFVVLPFVVIAWVLMICYQIFSETKGQASRKLFGALGIALSGAVGTLIAFAGNLWCYQKWGQFSPWRVMTTYTSAPWFNMYMLGEYRLEETTTNLNFWTDKYDIVLAHATPIGLWGMRLALAGVFSVVVCLLWNHRRVRVASLEEVRHEKGSGSTTLLYASLLTLCTLAPMTGLLDTSLYSFSGTFVSLQRYTLQWFMFAAVTICSAMAALEAYWPMICSRNKDRRLIVWMRRKTWSITSMAVVRNVPALLCACLCAISFIQGTNQQGYNTNFYRYSRNVVGDENTLLDTGFLRRYGLLMEAIKHVPENKKILLTRSGYQYPTRMRGYILTTNPIVAIMNLPLEEISEALSQMNVAMLVTEPAFWDERYYAKSTLSDYLNTLPAEQILQDGEMMRLYILDPALAVEIIDSLRSVQTT